MSAENGGSPGWSANASASTAVTTSVSVGPRMSSTRMSSGHVRRRHVVAELDRHLVLVAVAPEAQRLEVAHQPCVAVERLEREGPVRIGGGVGRHRQRPSDGRTHEQRGRRAASSSVRSGSTWRSVKISVYGALAKMPAHATTCSPRVTTGKSAPASRVGRCRIRRIPSAVQCARRPGAPHERPMSDVEEPLDVVVRARPHLEITVTDESDITDEA